ncbi:MAG: stage III sporulation protein AF [Acutalibacteraceae bacterium]|nr:stage III sporulation protein AF [Acutalibacteraceae bacterium]
MQEITLWANAVCAVAIVCAIFEMLAPNGNVSKMLNFVLGLFLVVAVLVPFTNLIKLGTIEDNNIDIKQEEITFSEQVGDLTIACGKSVIENLVADCLKEKEIKYKKIQVNMDSSTGNSIDIIKVKIYLSTTYRNQITEIQNIVKEKTGITPDVYVG